MPSRLRAAALVAAAYGLALGAAVAAGAAWPGASPAAPIWRALVGDLAATCVVFGFSVAFDNSSFYDPYWSVAPPALGGYWWWQAGARLDVRALLVLALVGAWAVRLTYNWSVGWRGLGHEDWRYVDIRRQSGRAYWLASFAGIHLFPTAQVFLGSLAIHGALAGRAPFGARDVLATAVTLAAILIEAIADAQLRAFAARPREPGASLERGLWALSRHPNYFGEVLFWWGLALFAVAAGPWRWWHLAGAATINAMFLVVSIPMMERRALARRPGYAAVQARVSKLVPWFRRG